MVEPVEIVNSKGSCLYPKFKAWKGKVDVKNMSKKIGINPVDIKKAMELLSKMSLACSNIERNETQIEVKAPPTRHDILHECDLVEDLALAYGYNNISPLLPQSTTVAEPFNLNKLSDQLRLQLAMSGWTEIMNFALCSTEDVGIKMRKPNSELKNVVKITNPKTLEFQVVRNSLLPGILKTISNNKDMPLPLKLFEVQDVVFIDNTQDTKCRNERHLAAIFYSKTGAFEIIHGLLDRLMQMLNVKYIDIKEDKGIKGYQNPSFFDGRCAEIIYKNKSIGTFGVLHPEVINSFALVNPCSALEINIEEFMYSDALLIIFIALFTALLGEGLTWLLVYRSEEYKRLKYAMERKTKKLEKKGNNWGFSKTTKRKIEREEERLKSTNRDLSMFRMKSMMAIGFVFTTLLSTFSSIFEGRVVAKLPFEPISWVQGLSHRNLVGEDYTDCSFIFLYILCTMTLRQNLQKMLGFAPSRALSRQNQGGGFFGQSSQSNQLFR
ncbi:Phenylalanine--tRNA ligase beta subunit [Meloidogyne graminicola]|uniref:phenylalanine--tRNA ligase n=1 Tax=Meloidogyne graminicola TaxID=189291 RepID=A0A8T0A4I8_9BILA|nr:Phenylalanine--tRNA ligase beta subunit [Meloidogyne graminicola]